MMCDLERLVSKVSVQRVNPRELIKLKETLNCIPLMKEVLSKIETKRQNQCQSSQSL